MVRKTPKTFDINPLKELGDEITNITVSTNLLKGKILTVRKIGRVKLTIGKEFCVNAKGKLSGKEGEIIFETWDEFFKFVKICNTVADGLYKGKSFLSMSSNIRKLSNWLDGLMIDVEVFAKRSNSAKTSPQIIFGKDNKDNGLQFIDLQHFKNFSKILKTFVEKSK